LQTIKTCTASGLLTFMTSEKLRLEYVPLSTAVQWDWIENPKLHDVGGIIQSIQEYGFRDPPSFDATLGAFAQGNGRTKALALMRRDGRYERPRYIGETEDGEWAIPVFFGADSKSIAAAQAFALDANNLVLTGGNTEVWDILALYDRQQLAELTASLGDQGLVTLDDDSLQLLQDDDEEEIDPKRQEKWTFKIHFNAPRELLDELQGLMGPYFVPRSRRKLMPEFFTAMVRRYCEDSPVVYVEEP